MALACAAASDHRMDAGGEGAARNTPGFCGRSGEKTKPAEKSAGSGNQVTGRDRSLVLFLALVLAEVAVVIGVQPGEQGHGG
jgi:hypothetical protein